MKKIILTLLLVVSFVFMASAGSAPIKKNGKVVGYLEYSVVKSPGPDGGFITINVYNNSGEYIHFTIIGKGVSGICSTQKNFSAWQKDDIVFSCSGGNPDDFEVLVYVE